MRFLILSDIHANLHALNAVLADAAILGYDEVIVLGDLVGYGGDPAAVIARTTALGPLHMIRGNHDKVCAGLASAEDFNDNARASIEWTRRTLGLADLATLAALPMGPVTINDGVEICHGTPFDEDHYILDARDLARAFAACSRPLCLFGHTHVPAIFERHGSRLRSESIDDTDDFDWRVPPAPAMVNVGSVGQPRDGDPRAAYGILDVTAGRLRLRRVDYDIAGAQARIREAGLPAPHAARLATGT